MKKWVLLLIVFIRLLSPLWSQKPEEMLNKWSAKSPIEKIYLHFDRDNYIAGETVWFKAYLYSGYQADTISSNLYVELANNAGNMISRVVLPVFFGGTNGQFELPDSLTTGLYFIRSYTPSMLNNEAGFISSQSIFVYGKNAPLITTEKRTRLEFFPEGGNLISSVPNTIAFRAVDENGMPVAVKGKVVNSRHEVVTAFDTYHDGMGMFELTPLPGEKYFASADEDINGEFDLPAQTAKGIALSVIPHPQGYFFEIKQKKGDPDFRVAYMIGQMQHQVVFKQDIKTNNDEIRGVINTQHLYSGILQITFFNEAHQPLAERLCFVNNKEYVLKGDLMADTLNFAERSKNRFSIQLKDTVQGTFSVSVTDAAFNFAPVREENIFTGLLLTADIKGYVHNPAYYFSRDDDSAKTALDLVMMTNGWRRFKWTELSQKLSQSYSFKNNAYITLSGKITFQDMNKPFADKDLLLMITNLNRKRSTHFLHTDVNGKFFLDSLIFFDKNRLLICDVRGKKSQYIDVYPDSDSLHRHFALPALATSFKRIMNSTPSPAWQMDYDAILKENGLMLETVTVKAKRRSAMQDLDDRYTTGLFSKDATRAIDLVNSEEANPYQNIFDYLQSRVPGLHIAKDGFDYTLIYRQFSSASSMGNIPMTLFLDEFETDASYIASIPASEIALVKVYSTFAGAVGNAPGGAMAIYTKKGTDYVSKSSFVNHSIYNGYSVVKEFYAPDYSVTKKDGKTDNRITLDWRPNILINNIDPKLPFSFYNNDRTKSFRVVVEGMTNDGKLLMIEKIFSTKGF
ncbi:MAG: hypothetical protein HOP10_00570 [Chitinophagaceae bacterium]|nr:hypothetical protein [Chitinophagaceae bacterium]